MFTKHNGPVLRHWIRKCRTSKFSGRTLHISSAIKCSYRSTRTRPNFRRWRYDNYAILYCIDERWSFDSLIWFDKRFFSIDLVGVEKNRETQQETDRLRWSTALVPESTGQFGQAQGRQGTFFIKPFKHHLQLIANLILSPYSSR